jgi:hypothetical protein
VTRLVKVKDAANGFAGVFAKNQATVTWGPVVEAPAETWKAVEMALYFGLRGLKKGTTLARLRP